MLDEAAKKKISAWLVGKQRAALMDGIYDHGQQVRDKLESIIQVATRPDDIQHTFEMIWEFFGQLDLFEHLIKDSNKRDARNRRARDARAVNKLLKEVHDVQD